MQYSNSRIDTFEKCQFKYKMRYVDGIKTIAPTEADNALIIGQALHTGIEKDFETAESEYFAAYPIITDEHINEAMKLEKLIPKAKAMIPQGEFEVEINTPDFQGFIDLLAPALPDGKNVISGTEYFDIYDFKYSNNVNHYMDSKQLHLYKYFFEMCNPGKKIRNLYFLFIPKINIKQKKTESLLDFRKRIDEELNRAECQLVPVPYQYKKVIDWLLAIKTISETAEFEKNNGYLCRYCEYEEFCMKGNDFMNLPKNERRIIGETTKRVMWLYGAPFTGKTTFANDFPEPLMLNTDGNIKYVDAPFIRIKDEVTVEGRQTKRKFMSEVFKECVDELEKKENTFKTLVVDLLEDLYEGCRVYKCDEMGISHESDDSFKAWDKVRSEFLNTLKRLMNLDYENIILISHEDTTRDITKRGGDKITSIKPNIAEKVANKVAGMVDIVARIVADGDVRTLDFKSNEVVFGGGRLKVKTRSIPLDIKELYKVYDEANSNTPANATEINSDSVSEDKTANDTPAKESPSESVTEGRKRRSRKTEDSESNSKENEPAELPFEPDKKTAEEGNWYPGGSPKDETATESTEPPKRTRKRRSE